MLSRPVIIYATKNRDMDCFVLDRTLFSTLADMTSYFHETQQKGKNCAVKTSAIEIIEKKSSNSI